MGFPEQGLETSGRSRGAALRSYRPGSLNRGLRCRLREAEEGLQGDLALRGLVEALGDLGREAAAAALQDVAQDSGADASLASEVRLATPGPPHELDESVHSLRVYT